MGQGELMNVAKLFFIACLPLALQAHAGVLADKTRLVYSPEAASHGLTLVNTNAYPVLVQTWIDKGEPDNLRPDQNAPYVMIPPVFRLLEKEVKSVRVIYNGKALPQDKETLYWINIYETPATGDPATKAKKLLMSMKTQLKIIFRPVSLKGDLLKALQQVSCQLRQQNRVLSCQNRSGHYVFFNSIEARLNGETFEAHAELDMLIAPQSASNFMLKKSLSAVRLDNNSLRLNMIKDDGSVYRRQLAIE